MRTEEMTLQQIMDFVNCLSSKKIVKAPSVEGEIRIVVLQRGWVVVGRYYRNGTECRLEYSSVIRRWGTTQGLGELASKGPLADTKLEPSGITRFHRSAEVLTLDCNAANWEKVCR
jgi:hypothetical protein